MPQPMPVARQRVMTKYQMFSMAAPKIAENVKMAKPATMIHFLSKRSHSQPASRLNGNPTKAGPVMPKLMSASGASANATYRSAAMGVITKSPIVHMLETNRAAIAISMRHDDMRASRAIRSLLYSNRIAPPLKATSRPGSTREKGDPMQTESPLFRKASSNFSLPTAERSSCA